MAVISLPNGTTASPQCPVLPDGAKAIVPSDADTFQQAVGVYCGVGGNVVCSPGNGNPDVTIAVNAGQFIPFRVLAVKATGTTASGLVAVY